MKKVTFRRLIAYVLDIIIVSIIASALSGIKFLNPYYDKYIVVQEKYTETITNSEDDSLNVTEFLNSDEASDLLYDMSHYGIFISIYTVVVSFLYFVVFQYFTKGKTLGKLLTKIEVVSNDGQRVSFMSLLKRSIIINSLVTSSILIVMNLTLSKTYYLRFSNYVQILDYALVLLSCGFLIYREDGLGLHDLFGGTRVILSSEREKYIKYLDESKKEVKEAKVVKEKTKPKKED